jgi:AraC family transcriptional regulator
MWVASHARTNSGAGAWKNYALVIDVPETSQAIHFGLSFGGPGTIWADDFRFEQVSTSVPLTTPFQRNQPANLDFRSK